MVGGTGEGDGGKVPLIFLYVRIVSFFGYLVKEWYIKK
jgi:hypothetical protein